MERSLHVLRRRLILLAAAALAALGCTRTPPADPASPGPARRIVSLAPAFTETLVAIGAGEAVVGIGAFDPEVPGRPGLPRLGDAFSVSLESVVALRPDLVLVNSKSAAETLRPVSARLTVLTPPTDRLEDALALVEDLGRRTGHAEEAARVLGAVRTALDGARDRAAQRKAAGALPPRVLVVVQRRPLYVAGRTSFVADLLRAVGAENAVDDVEQAWPLLSEEAAVARAPDVILDASEGDNATPEGRAALLATWDRFQSVPAVRNRRVLVICEDAIVRAGPRIPEALAKLEALLWPETPR